MSDPHLSSDDANSPRWLDRALARSLQPPRLPPGLLDRVRATARHDALLTLRQRQATLELELAQARRQLAQREVLAGLQVLGVAMAVSFAGGALAAWTLPLWSPWLGEQAALALPVLALGLGITTAGLALRMR
jgi:hypothetical protein